MDDLLREAIADAKAVRETALENAKIALEEAFTPRLQSMLSKKIAAEVEGQDEEEMEDEDAPEEMRGGVEDEDDIEDMAHAKDEMKHDADETEDSDEMGHEKDEMAHDKDEEEVEDDHAMGHEEMRGDNEEEMDSEEMRDSEEEDDLEKEAAHDKEEEDDKEEMREEEDSDEEMEEELDLESVLAELEADLNEEDKDEDDDAEEMRENDVSSEIGKADNKINPEAGDSSKTGAQGPEGEGSDKESGKELGDHEVVDDLTEVEDKDEKDDVETEDLDLDEVLKALSEEEKEEADDEKVEELQAELKETRQVVQFMRDKLNEVNLLNAKLLFSNKLFRAFGLNNDQKLKVVETFDRTKNLREVKLVYATLAESFKRPKSNIVESKGSSSKPVRSTKPAKQEVLSEGAEMRARFKKLANIL
jgi:hypothetical protein